MADCYYNSMFNLQTRILAEETDLHASVLYVTVLHFLQNVLKNTLNLVGLNARVTISPIAHQQYIILIMNSIVIDFLQNYMVFFI